LKKITLEVSKSNIFTTNLYIKNGFEEIGKRKNYYKFYTTIIEDGLIFEKK